MTKKLIQSSHPGRKTFKKLYEQEKFIKLTQDQFFAESETVYTRSQTRLAIITQSLIVNHNVKHPSRIDHNVTPHAMGSASGHIKKQLTFDFLILRPVKYILLISFKKRCLFQHEKRMNFSIYRPEYEEAVPQSQHQFPRRTKTHMTL